MALPILGAAAGFIGRMGVGAASRAITSQALRATIARLPLTPAFRQRAAQAVRDFSVEPLLFARDFLGARTARPLVSAVQAATRSAQGRGASGPRPVAFPGRPGVPPPPLLPQPSGQSRPQVAPPPLPPPPPPTPPGRGGAPPTLPPQPPPFPPQPGTWPTFQPHGRGGFGQPPFGEFNRHLHDATLALHRYTRETERGTRSRIDEQRSRQQWSGAMTEASMMLDFSRMLRDQRIAQRTAPSFAAMTREQNRLEEALLPFRIGMANVGNMVATWATRGMAAFAEVARDVGFIGDVIRAIERMAEEARAEDSTTTDKLFDFLAERAKAAREPRARRR